MENTHPIKLYVEEEHSGTKTTKVKTYIEANRLERVMLSDVGGNLGVFLFSFLLFSFSKCIFITFIIEKISLRIPNSS